MIRYVVIDKQAFYLISITFISSPLNVLLENRNNEFAFNLLVVVETKRATLDF